MEVVLCETRKCQSKKKIKYQWKHLTEQIVQVIINYNVMGDVLLLGSYPNIIVSGDTPSCPKSSKKKVPKKMSSQQKPITNEEKLIIINSYEEGIPPSLISKQIGKTVGSITKFYSRWKLDKDLPPKVKKNRSLIDGRMGMLIKNQVSETPKLGLKKLAAKIKEKVTEET